MQAEQTSKIRRKTPMRSVSISFNDFQLCWQNKQPLPKQKAPKSKKEPIGNDAAFRATSNTIFHNNSSKELPFSRDRQKRTARLNGQNYKNTKLGTISQTISQQLSPKQSKCNIWKSKIRGIWTNKIRYSKMNIDVNINTRKIFQSPSELIHRKLECLGRATDKQIAQKLFQPRCNAARQATYQLDIKAFKFGGWNVDEEDSQIFH